jgi:hypothetical protein
MESTGFVQDVRGGDARAEDLQGRLVSVVCAGWDRIFYKVKVWLVGCRQGGLGGGIVWPRGSPAVRWL